MLLVLAACDDAEARKNLAECMLSPQAKDRTGGWDDNYLSLCMQARGFVIDNRLTWNGSKCDDLPYPQIVAECFRTDTWFAEWIAGLRT